MNQTEYKWRQNKLRMRLLYSKVKSGLPSGLPCPSAASILIILMVFGKEISYKEKRVNKLVIFCSVRQLIRIMSIAASFRRKNFHSLCIQYYLWSQLIIYTGFLTVPFLKYQVVRLVLLDQSPDMYDVKK